MKDQFYICDHYESCPDEDCPHKIPHKWRDIAHVSDPCDGDMCDSVQIFEITRAPEAAPLTARDLHKLLHFARTDTEWGVREKPAQIMPRKSQINRTQKDAPVI